MAKIDLTNVVTPDDFNPYVLTEKDREKALKFDEQYQRATNPIPMQNKELEQSIANGRRIREYQQRAQAEREFNAKLASSVSKLASNNIYEDAFAVINPPDDYDPVSLAKYEGQVKRKARANKIISIAAYQCENNPELKRQYDEFVKQQEDPDNPLINKISLQADWQEKLAQQYNEVINKHGGVSDELLLDANFRKYCTPLALDALLSARESLERTDGKDGWFRKAGRMWDQEAERRRAAVEFLQSGNKVAYDKTCEQLAVKYERSYDGETMKSTIGSLAFMLQPIVDHPVKSVLSGVGAAVTGLVTKNPALAMKVLGYGYSAELFADGLEQFQSDMFNAGLQSRRERLAQIDPDFKNKTDEELAQIDSEMDKEAFLSRTRGAAGLSSLLNVVGAKYLTRGASDFLKPFLENVQRQAIEKPLAKAAEETVKALATDIAVNTAITGAQQYVNTASALNAVGDPAAWDKAAQNGLEGLKAAVAPSAIISSVFSVPRLFGNLRRYTVDNQARNITQQRIQTEEQLHQQLQQQGLAPEAQTALFQRVLGDYGEVAFNPQQVMDTIDTLHLEGEAIPEPFRDREKLEEMAQNGEEITMNKAKFYQDNIFTDEQRKAFGRDYRYTDLSEKTIKDLEDVTDEQKIRMLADEIAERFGEEDRLTQEDMDIAAQVEQRLARQNVGSVQARSANARAVAAFCRAMSKMTDNTPQEILDAYIYHIVRNDKVDALNVAQDQSVDYDSHVKGKTNPVTHMIELNPDADVSTILEEFAHNMLLVTEQLIKTGKANEQVKNSMQDFKKWLGDENVDLSNVTEQNRYAHEAFVTAFMQYLITGRADKQGKHGIAALRGFKELLGNVSRSRNAYGEDVYASDFKDDIGNQKKAEKLGKNYEQLYGKILPKLNNQFDALITAMFHVERKAEDEKLRAELTSIFDGIDPTTVENMTAEDMKAFVDLASKGEAELKDALLKEEVFNKPLVFQALSEWQMNRARKAAGVNAKYSEIVPASIKTKEEMKAFTSLCNYLKKREKDLADDIGKWVKTTALSNIYDTIRQNKINVNDPVFKALPKKQRDALINAKLASKNGTLSADSVQRAFSNFQTVDPRNRAAKTIADNFGNSKDGLEFLSRNLDESSVANSIVDELMKGERELLKEQFTAPDAGVYVLDTRLDRNRREWKILNGQTYSKENLQLCRDTARSLVAKGNFAKMTVTSLINKANRAHKQAQEYLKRGDQEKAFKSLRAERVLMEQAKLVAQAKPALEKRLKKVVELASKTDKTLAKRYDMKIITMARVLLSQIGAKDWRMSYKNIDINYEGIASNPDLVDFYNLIAGVKEEGAVLSGDWHNKTYQDVELIVRMADAIERIARKQGWLKNKGAYDLAVKDAQAEMIASLNNVKDRQDAYDSNGNGGGAPRRSKSIGRRLKASLQDYNYSFMRPENFFQELDGKDTEGGWHKYVYTPIKNAEIGAQKDLAQWYKDVREAGNQHKLVFREDEVVDCPELKFSDEVREATGLDHMCLGTSKDGLRAGEQLLGMILHMGNRDNLNKFLKGYFGDNVTEEVFIQWFNRMINEGHITKEMLDYAQSIWDINKKYFEGVQKAHYETKGYDVKVIDPRVIHTKWGDYAGGVVRAIANDDLVVDATVKADDFNTLSNSVERDLPTVKNGFTQSRKQGAVRPLCIDAQRLIQETRNMILYTHFQPALTAVNKVLNTEMRARLERKRPNAYEKVIKPWLATTIQQKTTLGTSEGVMKSFFDFMGYCTRMIGQAIMVGNLNNTLQQMSGFVSLMTKVPPSQVALAVCRSLGKWSEIKAECERSEFMQNRLRNVNDGIQNIFQDMIFTSSNYDNKLTKGRLAVKQASTWARQHSYFMQKFFQDYIDRVSYDAAYNHSLKQGKTEEQAQRYAESVVRTTQSSFDVGDMTAVEKSNPMVKMFTQFGGYFYTMFRLQTSQIHMICAQNNVSSVHKALSIAWTIGCSMVLPAIVAEAINGVMRGDAFNDDDKDHAYAKAVLMSVPRMYAGALPFYGKAVTYGLEKLDGDGYQSSSVLSNPTTGAFENLFTAAGKVFQGKDLKPNDVKAGIQIVAALSGCPMLAWFGRVGAYEYGVQAKYYMPENTWDLLRGYLTGVASPQSKNY